MNKNYELRTLKDVFDKVPTNRIWTCMKEIAVGMVIAKTTLELSKSIAEAEGEAFPMEAIYFPEVSVWQDDGKGEIGLRLADVEIGSFTINGEK